MSRNPLEEAFSDNETPLRTEMYQMVCLKLRLRARKACSMSEMCDAITANAVGSDLEDDDITSRERKPGYAVNPRESYT